MDALMTAAGLTWLYSARALAFTAAETFKFLSRQLISWAQSGHSTWQDTTVF